MKNISHKPEGNGLSSDRQSHKPEGNGLSSDRQSHSHSQSHKPEGNGWASDKPEGDGAASDKPEGNGLVSDNQSHSRSHSPSHKPEGSGLASSRPEGDGAASDSRSHSQSHKRGYTTGTCAQAAAYAAGLMLTTGKRIDSVEITTPSKVKLALKVIGQKIGDGFVRCAVVKDAADDAPQDVTHGMKIYAEVRPSSQRGIQIHAGKGIGRLTKPGLALPAGEYAINPVPRKMIERELSALLSNCQYKGFKVTISAPEGRRLSGRTFNPRLGIVGGISILGTTGIVEPKSLRAYKASLALQLDVLKSSGQKQAVLVLGYVSEKFAQETLTAYRDSIVKIGDHIGFMLRQCARKKIKEVLLIGHLGKMIKVAGGQFNTHCDFGDNRLKLIARYARDCGANEEITARLKNQVTSEAAIKILRAAGLKKVFPEIARDVVKKLRKLTGAKVRIQCIILSLKGEVLATL